MGQERFALSDGQVIRPWWRASKGLDPRDVNAEPLMGAPQALAQHREPVVYGLIRDAGCCLPSFELFDVLGLNFTYRHPAEGGYQAGGENSFPLVLFRVLVIHHDVLLKPLPCELFEGLGSLPCIVYCLHGVSACKLLPKHRFVREGACL
jgi:hypothetical protein